MNTKIYISVVLLLLGVSSMMAGWGTPELVYKICDVDTSWHEYDYNDLCSNIKLFIDSDNVPYVAFAGFRIYVTNKTDTGWTELDSLFVSIAE